MEKSPESIEHYDEDPSVESLLFDAKMLKSKESFERIKQDSEVEGIDFDSLHTKQKLLFSHILPEAKPSAQSGNYIDLRGLNMGDRRYSFDDDCLKYIHGGFVRDTVEGATNEDELEEKLDEAGAAFLTLMTERAIKETAEIRAEFTKKADAVRNEIDDKYTPINDGAACRQAIMEILPDSTPDECKAKSELILKEKTKQRQKRSDLFERHKSYSASFLKSGDEGAEAVEKSIYSIVALFKEQDTLARKYEATGRIAKHLNLPPESKEVADIFDSMRFKASFDRDPALAEIAKQYRERCDKDENTNYEALLFGKYGKTSAVNEQRLQVEFGQRQHEAFVQYCMAYCGMTKQQAEKLSEIDFYDKSLEMKREYILKHSDLTPEELNVLGRGIDLDPSSMIGPFFGEFYRKHESESKKEYGAKSSKYHITNKSKEAVRKAVQSYFDKILESEEANLPKNLNAPIATRRRIFGSHAMSRAKERRTQFDSLEEARKNAEEKFAALNLRATPSAKDVFDSFEKKMRKRINICARAYDAGVYTLSTKSDDDRETISAKLAEIKSEEEAVLSEYATNGAKGKAKNDVLSFGRSILGDSISDFYVLPTGFVFRDAEGALRSIALGSNLDSISTRLSDKDRAIWNAFTAKLELSSNDARQQAISYVNDFVDKEYGESVSFASPEEQDVTARAAKLHVKEPDVIGGQRSILSEQYSSNDIADLEHCLSAFGKYIKPENCVATPASSIPTEEAAKSQQQSFLLGIKPTSLLLISSDHGLTLPIKKYSLLADTGGEAAADICIKSDIVTSAFENNKSILMPLVKKVLGNRANASQVDILRLTGKNVASPIERSNIAARAYFLSAYMHYLNGEEIEDPKLAELIQRVDNLVYPEETPGSRE